MNKKPRCKRNHSMFRDLLVAFVLMLVLCAGGASSEAVAPTKLKVGATPVPHSEILEIIKPILKDKGILLEVIEFTDYVTPNLALNDGDIDANYFQHIPYLEEFAEARRLDITYIARVHIEPMGVYSKKVKDLKDVKNKAKVGIPSDPTNGGRALLLLQKAGIIKLDDKAGIAATKYDIISNPKNIQIIELEAAQLPRSLEDLDLAIINSNYALEAGLISTRDALIIEDADSPYVNVLAVRTKDKDKTALIELAKALTSDTVAEFIREKYPGSVVPAFGLEF